MALIVDIVKYLFAIVTHALCGNLRSEVLRRDLASTATALSPRHASTGESRPFGPAEGWKEQLPSDHGFEPRLHYTPEELKQVCFTASDGTVLKKVNGTLHIATASLL